MAVLLLPSCGSDGKDSGLVVDEAPVMDELILPEPALRRLSQAQYHRAIVDLLGDDLVHPTSLEPDESIDGLRAIGASLTTISPRGVEQYEDAAYSLAEQALETGQGRQSLVPCEPESTVDTACAEMFFTALGRRAWRRPLSTDEVQRLVSVSSDAAQTLDDFHAGLVYGVAALLQSPHFLFRVELGQETDDGTRRFTDFEMATRLSFLLWDAIPDDELLDAAEAGELTDAAGLQVSVDRLLADPRIEQGIRAIFSDMLALHELEELNKDPTIFTHMSPEVGPSAREETLLGIVNLVLEEDGDYRDLFTTRTTFLNRKLASIYNVRAPVREGFAPVELSEDGGRRGILGQASFLALNSHAVSTSATLRGLFVREVLLCQHIPPPPSDVDTSIPEASGEAVTLRERVAEHLENEFCATCHEITDPIGLGFENFDGLGHWRSQELGASIDASGELDGQKFNDAWQLAGVVADHPELPGCLVETMLSYGSGHSITRGERPAVDFHAWHFENDGFRVSSLLKQIALSPAFRHSGVIE